MILQDNLTRDVMHISPDVHSPFGTRSSSRGLAAHFVGAYVVSVSFAAATVMTVVAPTVPAKAVKGADAISPRQRQAADLAARGASDAEIAQALGIVRGTVKAHLRAAYRILGIRKRSGLAAALGIGQGPVAGGLRRRGLTPAETNVALAMAEGLSNKQIGARLGIGEGTVKCHTGSINRKLGTRNRAEVAMLVRRGCVSGIHAADFRVEVAQ